MECKDKDENPACKNGNEIGSSKDCTDGSPACLTVKCETESVFVRGCGATVTVYMVKLALIEFIKVGAHTP